MTHEQIKQRLLFIIEDATTLMQHIESGKAMDEPTAFADISWTHLYNIKIAADLQDSEAETWRKQRKQEYMGITGKVSHDPELARLYNKLLKQRGVEGMLALVEQWMDDSDLKSILAESDYN